MDQVVEHLSGKCKAQSSNLSTFQKKQNKTKQNKKTQKL
jgi:hypothetical protein